MYILAIFPQTIIMTWHYSQNATFSIHTFFFIFHSDIIQEKSMHHTLAAPLNMSELQLDLVLNNAHQALAR